ncbi:MAG: radical SAM protein [Dysgonamonadaceae bacterium]|jgi:hypothetical protein|nr:radical SAM protein [Dysgonamonadaceae bacterium]
MKKEIILKRIALIPSFRCNLNCRLCISSSPNLPPGNDMTIEEAKKTLKLIFTLIDKLELLQISGGEPFLFKELAPMIFECFKYADRFEKFMLFTNGTVPLRDDVFEIIKQHKDKFILFISNYGLHTERFNAFIKTINKNSITYRIMNYHGDDQYFGGWVDFGEYVSYNRTPAMLSKVFHSCGQVQCGGCWQVQNGQIHWCPRSLRGTLAGFIPSRKNIDYIDIFDTETTLDEKRTALYELIHADYFLGCDYCTGDMGTNDPTKRYPAAEQKVARHRVIYE